MIISHQEGRADVMRTIINGALGAPMAVNRKIAAMSLFAARFITRTGSSRVESVFWIVGASTAAFGAAIIIASKLGDVAGILTLQRWRSTSEMLELGGTLLAIYLVGHIFLGLVRAVREESRWIRHGGDRP